MSQVRKTDADSMEKVLEWAVPGMCRGYQQQPNTVGYSAEDGDKEYGRGGI